MVHWQNNIGNQHTKMLVGILAGGLISLNLQNTQPIIRENHWFLSLWLSLPLTWGQTSAQMCILTKSPYLNAFYSVSPHFTFPVSHSLFISSLFFYAREGIEPGGFWMLVRYTAMELQPQPHISIVCLWLTYVFIPQILFHKF